jgi:excinuclease ABC subunit B
LSVSRRLNQQELESASEQVAELALGDIPELIGQLEAQMKECAKKLDFEKAAEYRDRIHKLRERLLGK